MKPWQQTLLGFLLGLLVSAGILLIGSQPRGTMVELLPAPTQAPLLIDVSGAVNSPAVVSVPPGSRVKDALAAAGGLSANADTRSLNLAAPLLDGQKIVVPEEGVKSTSQPGGISLPTGTPAKVNINTADAEQLMTLPGIGSDKAGHIIDYRQKMGPFTSIDQLMDVPGIGSSTFENLKDLITVID